MNLSTPEGMLNLYMTTEELDDFKQYLNIAIEDLVNVRPDNAKKYLALALCRALPCSENLRFDFPELAKELNSDFMRKSQSAFESIPESPSKISKLEYPEGFQISRRASVCGESILEDELAWTPPNFPKTPETLEKLKNILKANILFSHLSEFNLSTVVMALEPLEINEGETVTKQNEQGNSCYFIESGKLSCFVKERGLVCEYSSGDSFGEASIMYDNLRGATIKVIYIQSISHCKLWKLDRLTYKKIVLTCMLPTFSKFLDTMSNVEVFSIFYLENLSKSTLNDLAKHCHNLKYPNGSDIYVKSSDRYIYLIKTGKVALSSESKELGELAQYDFFGIRDIFGLQSEAVKAKADGECEIYRMPEPLLDTLLKEIKQDLQSLAANKLL